MEGNGGGDNEIEVDSLFVLVNVVDCHMRSVQISSIF